MKYVFSLVSCEKTRKHFLQVIFDGTPVASFETTVDLFQLFADECVRTEKVWAQADGLLVRVADMTARSCGHTLNRSEYDAIIAESRAFAASEEEDDEES